MRVPGPQGGQRRSSREGGCVIRSVSASSRIIRRAGHQLVAPGGGDTCVLCDGRSARAAPANLWGTRAPTTGAVHYATVLSAILQSFPCICVSERAEPRHRSVASSRPSTSGGPRLARAVLPRLPHLWRSQHAGRPDARIPVCTVIGSSSAWMPHDRVPLDAQGWTSQSLRRCHDHVSTRHQPSHARARATPATGRRRPQPRSAPGMRAPWHSGAPHGSRQRWQHWKPPTVPG